MIEELEKLKADAVSEIDKLISIVKLVLNGRTLMMVSLEELKADITSEIDKLISIVKFVKETEGEY